MMTLPPSLRNLAETLLQTTVIRFVPAAGGCINRGGELKTSAGKSYFIKWNSARHFPDMFVAEQHGLNLLAKTQAIRVPGVVGVSQNNTWQIIIMEFIKAAPPSGDYNLLPCTNT